MGDPVYAVGFKSSSSKLTPEARKALEMLGRQALHAAEIGFEHPVSGRPLHFTSPLPADMQNLIRALRKNSGDGSRGGATRKTRAKVSKR
jgi:23S rRNA pseudouridine1911/1915/1917 synthase